MEDDVDIPLDIVETFTEIHTAHHTLNSAPTSTCNAQSAIRARKEVEDFVTSRVSFLPEGYRNQFCTRPTAALLYRELGDLSGLNLTHLQVGVKSYYLLVVVSRRVQQARILYIYRR